MKVSVIIPAYNAAETIAETLESLLAQTDPNWEAIVVDDGSSDRTAEITGDFVKKDSRIRLTRRPNGRESAARNTGIAEARYDWLLFLDADDWIAPAYLERMTGELIAHPELDAVHCGSARVAPDGTRVVEKYLPPTGDMFATWARRSAFPVHACVVRRSLVEAVGRFDPSLRKSSDWDLWQRVARTGACFGSVREVLAFYRMRPNATSLDAPQMLLYGLRVLKTGHSPDPRVPNPHPDHANGSPPEQIVTQEFYLLCWCAGLLLGGGKDARALLDTVKEDHFPELYPDAVAQCIFDAAPLPTCQPPQAWERLWPAIQRQVNEFLVALEEQSMAPDLARKADAALKAMILKHSPTWQSVVGDYERTLEEQKLRLAELERASAQLEKERGDFRGVAEERARTIEEQKLRLAELERASAQLEKERGDWRGVAEDHARTIEEQKLRLAELERASAQLEKERGDWRGVAEERAQTIEEQKGLLAELERTSARLEKERGDWQGIAKERAGTIEEQKGLLAELEQERDTWQQLAEERQSILTELRKTLWVRLGVRLRFVKNLPKDAH